MKIVVCIKQVPDTTNVKIDPETNNLVRRGVKAVINPFDTYALEEGVRIRQRYGGTVTVLTMGPPQAEEMLREAISLGADDMVLLCDRAFAGADTWATARTLAAAITKIGDVDLVLCGRQTMDGDTGQVGPELAEMLNRPFISYVSKIEEITGTTITLRRMIEEGYERIESPLPAVLTVSKEINMPRLPSLRGIFRSREMELPVWSISDLPVEAEKVGLSGSATRVVTISYPQRDCQAEILEGEPEEQVKTLITKLQANGLI